jgi:hypothetical protein
VLEIQNILITDYSASGLTSDKGAVHKSGVVGMNRTSKLARYHLHILGLTLIAAGLVVHAAQPMVQDSVQSVVTSPQVLAIRASYNFAVGDVDSAMMLAHKASKPTSCGM